MSISRATKLAGDGGGGAWSRACIRQWYKGVTDSGPPLKCLNVPSDRSSSVSHCDHAMDSRPHRQTASVAFRVTADRPLRPRYRPGQPNGNLPNSPD